MVSNHTETPHKTAHQSTNDSHPYQKPEDKAPAHCKWCESQGLTAADDELFEVQFKRIVGSMRRNENRYDGGPHVYDRSSMESMRGKQRGDDSTWHYSHRDSYAVWTRWGAAQSLLALIVVAIIGVLFGGHSSAPPTALIKQRVVSCRTITGSLKIDITRYGAMWSQFGTQVQAPVLFWRGGFEDELSLLEGRFDRCNWVKVTGDTLSMEDGTILYGANSPELEVIENMRRLRDRVSHYYQTYGHYPDHAQDLQGGAIYVNPITGRSQSCKIKHVINGSLVAGGAGGSLENTTLIKNSREADKQPGSIWAVGVKSDPIIAADYNSYEWRNNCFYIYGNDRNANLITGSGRSKHFIISLRNGSEVTELQRPSMTAVSKTVCFYSGTKPEIANIRWRYGFLCFALFLLGAASVVRSFHMRVREVR